MQENLVLHKNPDIVTREIDNEMILLPIYKTSEEINCIYTLNKPASRVWGLIDGKRSIAAIKKFILKEFDTTSKEADQQMNRLIKDFKKIKAVI